MSAARLDFAPVLQRLLAPFAGHPLLERLFFSSVELAVLALLVFAAIRVGRIRSPRLAALLWLLVLGKPLVSLAIGSPFHLFRMEVPSAVVAAPAPLAQAVPTDPQPPFAMSSSSSADVQSPPEPIVMDEEMAAAPFAPLPEKATPTPATPPVTSAVAVQAPLTHTPSPWNPAKWILGIWLTGVAFFAGLSLLDRARIRRLVRTARKPEPSLADRYAAIAAEMGLKRPAPLRVTDEMEGPALAGSIWSTILIPAWLAEDANEAKLDWALRHELMHFRLRDPWAGLVRELSHMLFYFHPAAWWAGANWKTATEKACDRAIVADEAAALDYAEQLYRILAGIHGRRQAALRTGLFATRTQIGQRIAALLYGPRTAPHLSAVALVAVALVTAVTLSVGGAFADKNAKRDEPEKTPTVATADKVPEPQLAPISGSSTSQPTPAPATDVTFTYAGTVIDDHGKPVAGAKISLDYWHAAYPADAVPTLAVTDSKGRFEFSRRERDFADAGLWGPWWLRAMIVATKPGYGLGGRQSIEFEATGRLAAEQHEPSGRRPKDWSNVLKLSLDDVPIHGRILDTDGRPVSGALVETINLWEGQDGSLDTWEATVLRPGAAFGRHWQKLRPINFEDGFTAPNPTLLPTVRTDANGSFTLNGLGRERIANLAVSAPGIESTVVGVRTRRGAFIKVPLDQRNRGFGEEKFYPCDFTLLAGTSVPVEGQVTDAQSHQPLAGVTVKAAPFPFALHRHISAESRISATTNARGRYRLDGLPPGRARLGVFPPPGSRYLMAGVDVQTWRQQRPLAFDIKLAPGIIVRGRATDARTGMPVQGSLQYFAFRTNPHLQEAPGFGQTFGFLPFPQLRYRYRCAVDGRFEIPVLPGPGILTFFGDSLERFPVAIGAADIDASQKRDRESTLFATAPWDCNAKMFHLLTPLNPQPGTDSLALDVTVRSPATVTGTVRGPDGRPLGNYRLFDDTSFVGVEGHWRSYRDANFETKVYSPADHHWLMFYQRASNLVGFREFTGEPKEPLDITLQRGATLKGRIVENGGQPLGDVSLLITAREAVAHGNRAAEARGAAAAMGRQFDQSQIMVDKNGRFELCAVTPGVAYSASLPRGTVFTNMTAQAGESKELGDLQIAAADSKSAPAPTARKNQAEVKTIRGRVLLPDGRPAGEAKLSMMRFHWKSGDRVTWERLAAATASAGGEFEIRVPSVDTSPEQLSLLVATAPGFGVQCVGYGAREVSHPLEIKLRPDQPVRGRLLDLEGKPVAGARVRVATITDSPRDDLGPWLAAMKAGVQRYSVAAHALLGRFLKGFPADGGSATTDGDGRFTLTGLGAERIVDLAVESERTAYAVITVATRHMEPIIRPSFPNNAGGLEILGDEFTESLRPTRPVVGVVRDAQTKRPLAGVSVESWHVAGEFFAGQRDVRTSTDAQGRYRLIGLPKGQGNAIFVVPNDEQPYFMRNLDVPDSAGMEAVTVDIELHRGLWITGCVTDKETGQPVLSQINYWPFLDNVFTQGRPEFGPGNTMQGDYARFRTREDGSFRVPGLPGHGLVGAEALSPNYRRGAGAAEIGGFDEDRRLRTFRNQGWPGAKYPTTMKEINPVKGTENVVCNLVCDHGETVRFTVLDPAGQPVNNCALSLPTMTKEGKARGVDSPFDVNNLSLDTAQPLVIEQKERQLGKFFVFTVKKDSPRSLTVRLEPTMTVAGRLVDQDGVPLSGISVQPMLRRLGDFSPQLPAIVCGSDGRFEYTGLPSGAKVDFQAVGTAIESLQNFGRMEVTPGKRVDLGEIKLKRRNSATPAATTSTAPENPLPAKTKDRVEVNVVHGRVLLPDSKPGAGARVVALRRYWVENVKRTPIAKTTAAPDGAFTMAIPKNTPDDGVGTAAGLAWIAAEVDGYGTNYQNWRRSDPTQKELAIKLLPEVPIHGRIVDLEGKPVAGVRVAVNWQASPRQEFGAWLESLRAGSLAEFEQLAFGTELQGYEDDTKPPVVTDPVGRFTLRGIGADRVIRLALHGDRIADTSIDVIARPIKPFPRQTGGEGTAQVFGADFTFEAAPTRLIVGTVRDGSTGMPLGGVSIRQFRGPVHTETDSQGKYRLVGLPKLKPGRGWESRYEISILPNPDQPYLALKQLDIPYSPGLDPITLDVKLPRGVWVTGRVTDKETGAPAVSAVSYFPALSNPLLKQFPHLTDTARDRRPTSYTGPDGTFRVVCLPGRGLIAVRGTHKIYVVGVEASRFTELAKNYPKDFYRQGFNISAIQEIEPAQGAAKVTCDLVVSAGGTMRVLLADRAGKPVSPSVFFYDMARGGLMNSVTDESPFDLTAFEPNESRPILFHCAKHRIGKSLLIHYDEKSPHSVTVTLEPWATVKGRIVDADGVPRKGGHLSIFASIGNHDWIPAGSSIDCDAGGRFVCDNVAPGADSYSVFADGADGRTKFMAVAGKTIDLGDIKPQRDEATVSTSKPDAAPRPAASPAKPAVAEVDVIHGRVLLPDGKPAAGARVFALRRFFTARGKRSPVAKMTAGPNGEFTLRLPKIQPADDVNAAGGLVIAAEAKGFGAQWRTLSPRLDSSKEELVLKLLPECPIHGRIVDLEGKPVGGVRVVVAWQNKIDGDFESWLKAAKAGDVPFRLRLGRPVLQMPGYDDESQPPVVTDRDGRFTLMGIGTDHLAQFELRGDTIAYAALDAVAHSIQPLTFKGRSSETSQLFGADFTYQAVPTRPIVGFVRDAVTGTPLAGVSIESTSGSGIRTETDVQGRYRLVGLAKARQNVINVVPNQDQPYFARKRVKVPESVGLAAITLDFNLTRGTWITGRVTDKATGAPVRSYVVYLPGVTNSLADKVPEFATGDADRLHLPEFSTGPDGRYRLVGLPGRGVVAGWTVGKQYIPDAVASRITRMARDRDLVSLWRKPAGMNFLREIDAASNSPSQTCDFVVDAGGTIRISILDQAGKPVRPCICLYEMPGGGMMQWGTNDSPCDLRGFLPGESRTLLFLAGQRQVGKAVVAHYDPKAANTLSVALEPCATVKGRLIDEEGIPIKRQEVRSIARGGGDLWLPVGLATSKSDGRFVLHNLVPGAEFYTISAHGFGNVAEKVVVAAGKTIDLGEIRLKREK